MDIQEKLKNLMIKFAEKPENYKDITKNIIRSIPVHYHGFVVSDEKYIEYLKIIFEKCYDRNEFSEEEIYLFKIFAGNYFTERFCEVALGINENKLASFFRKNEYILQDMNRMLFYNYHLVLKFAYEIENIEFRLLTKNLETMPSVNNEAMTYYNSIKEAWERGEFPNVNLKPAKR